MRKRDKLSRDAYGKKRKRKIDMMTNGHVDINKLKEREKGYKPLKITNKLSIMVPPEKCNQEYASEYRERNGIIIN
jgi:hypothetical protein